MHNTIGFIVPLVAAILALAGASFLVGYVTGFSRSADRAERRRERKEHREGYQGKRVLPDGQEGVQEAQRAFYQESEEA